ncbi:MAG: DUF2490 domain-containing protein [Prevotellaceae bacterium]|jgi:hypothetical protein|nr:DUF2490 domain-containing protein [Prevotellaceae bacterium]
MIGKIKYLLFVLLLPVCAWAQSEKETDVGAFLALEFEKDLSRFFSLSMEEEIRFVSNNTGFDRSVTSVGVDYSLFDKRVKLGGYYAFMYLYNNDYWYEPRHRFYVNVSYKESVGRYTLSWRGRLQSTYRDEDRGEYKINPKGVWKNKFEVDYALWGLPWKPFVSCEFSTLLNDPVAGWEFTRIRFQGGTTWRLDRTTYMNFTLRFDDYIAGKDPHVFSIGVTYKKNL